MMRRTSEPLTMVDFKYCGYAPVVVVVVVERQVVVAR